MKNRLVMAACIAVAMSASAMAQDAAKKEAATEAVKKAAADNAVEQVEATRDAATGLPTGKRQHKPVKATKELDKSSTKSVHQPGGGQTGQSRRTADVIENAEESANEVKDSAPVSDDDDVAKKTNTSEQARAKKRD